MDEPLFLPLISDLLDFADSLDDRHTTAGTQNTQNITNDSSDKESESKKVEDVADASAVGGEIEIIELDSISETDSYGGADSIKDKTDINDKDDNSDDDDTLSNLSAIPDESVESMVTFSTPSKKKNTYTNSDDDEMTRIVIFHRPSVDISRPPSPSKYSRNSVIEFRQPIISKEEKRRIKRRKQNKRNNKKRRSLQFAKNMIDRNNRNNRNNNNRYKNDFYKNRYNNNRNNSRYSNNYYYNNNKFNKFNRFRRNRFSRFRYHRPRIVYKRIYIDRKIKEKMGDDAMKIKEYRKNAYARKQRARLKGDEKIQLRYKKNRRNHYARELEDKDCESKISKRQKYRKFAEIIKSNIERRDLNHYSRAIRRERKKRLYEEYLVRCEERKKRHLLWLEREKIRQEKRKQREQMRRIMAKRRPSYLYWKKDEWYRQSLS